LSRPGGRAIVGGGGRGAAPIKMAGDNAARLS
jgi:hypothetical protein